MKPQTEIKELRPLLALIAIDMSVVGPDVVENVYACESTPVVAHRERGASNTDAVVTSFGDALVTVRRTVQVLVAPGASVLPDPMPSVPSGHSWKLRFPPGNDLPRQFGIAWTVPPQGFWSRNA